MRVTTEEHHFKNLGGKLYRMEHLTGCPARKHLSGFFTANLLFLGND